MASFRQVAHIQMFSRFPPSVRAPAYARMYRFLVTSVLLAQHRHWGGLHHNDLYCSRPCHICGPHPPFMCLSLSLFVSISWWMLHTHISLVFAFFLCGFKFPGHVFFFLWCTWAARYLECKLARLTFPTYESLTWHPSATINTRVIQCQQACVR